MARPARQCASGTWHHVFNRGVARRQIFDGEIDRRTFLSLLAKQVRAGRLELHAYCLLDNHFHLLVAAPTGELDVAIREICSPYVRLFNRAHDRDGPLFRSRFGSKLLKTERYRRATLCYIDRNPVGANLSRKPHHYPFGSAYHFHKGCWPRWLTDAWVRGVVQDWTGVANLPPGLYGGSERHFLGRESSELIEARMRSSATRDPVPEMITPDFAAGWLRDRAMAADGDGSWLPLAAPSTVRRVCKEEQSQIPDWSRLSHRSTFPLWPIVETGLLRRVACCTIADISSRLGIAESTVAHRYRLHDRLVLSDAQYQSRTTALTHRILRSAHG